MKMANKKIYFVISTAIVFGLLTGCGTRTQTNGTNSGTKTEYQKQEKVTAKFIPSLEIKEDSHDMTVKYAVKNISGKKQKLTFTNGLKADFVVYDQNGKKVKQYSEEVSATQATEEISLDNNKEIEQKFTISDLPNGQYKLEVFLTSKEEKAKSEAEFIVKNSLYTNGSGQYVGQMDPHTIEVNIDGNKTAFQLSDEAIKQLTSIKEGDQISFIYSEKESGQKTIERFFIKSY
jgi:Cu/Ag efflux protein CusF